MKINIEMDPNNANDVRDMKRIADALANVEMENAPAYRKPTKKAEPKPDTKRVEGAAAEVEKVLDAIKATAEEKVENIIDAGVKKGIKPEPATGEIKHTLDDVHKAIRSKAIINGMVDNANKAALKAKLGEFGASKASELKPEDYAAFISYAEGL